MTKGGAILAESITSLNINNVFFDQNIAGEDKGDAISMSNSLMVSIENS